MSLTQVARAVPGIAAGGCISSPGASSYLQEGRTTPRMAASGGQGGAVSANKYTLKHHNVEVEYDVDITP